MRRSTIVTFEMPAVSLVPDIYGATTGGTVAWQELG
jgi:hypothetical protein